MAAQAGAAAVGGFSTGNLVSNAKACGITLTPISMIAVPPTVGVIIVRSAERRKASGNWISALAMINAIKRGSPPRVNAVIATAMKAPDVPMNNRYPAPKRHTGRA